MKKQKVFFEFSSFKLLGFLIESYCNFAIFFTCHVYQKKNRELFLDLIVVLVRVDNLVVVLVRVALAGGPAVVVPHRQLLGDERGGPLLVAVLHVLRHLQRRARVLVGDLGLELVLPELDPLDVGLLDVGVAAAAAVLLRLVLVS